MDETWTIDGPRVLDIGGGLQAVDTVEVILMAGEVGVVTHDDSNAVRLEVTDLRGSALEVQWRDGRLRISHLPTTSSLADIWSGGVNPLALLSELKARFAGIERNSANLSVSIPRSSRVDVKTVSATALVSGSRADIAVKTVSGTVTVDDVVGTASMNSVSGEVEVRRMDGTAHVTSVSGAVTVIESSLASAAVKTVSGDVTLDLSNARADIDATSVSGDLTVRAPYSGFDLHAKSVSGAVVAGGEQLSSGGKPAGSTTRVVGDGGLHLRAKSVSGSITLLRAGGGPQDERWSESGPQDADPQDAVR